MIEENVIEQCDYLEKLSFDFKKLRVFWCGDNDGRYYVPGIIVDAGDNFSGARLARDFFLQDKAKEASVCEDTKKELREIFEIDKDGANPN